MNKELLEKHGFKVSSIIKDGLFNKNIRFKDIGEIHPIKVDEFEEFNEEYATFILINHDYLNIPKEDSLLSALVATYAYQEQSKQEKEDITEGGKYQSRLIVDPLKQMAMNKEKRENKGEKKKIKIEPKYIVQAIYKVSEMLSFMFKTTVTPSGEGIGFNVWNEDKTECKVFSDKDFEVFREIVLLHNALVEPVKYHDKIVDEWMQKARNARRKKDITFNDLIVVVKNSTNLKYEEIAEMNMIQFYSDYRWVNHKNDYDASILFKTVSNKVPNIAFTTNIIDSLFNNGEAALSMDASAITSKLGD